MLELLRPEDNPIKDLGREPIDIWSTEIISREKWGALPPKGDIEELPLPVKHIGFWGTEPIQDAKPGVCWDEEDCQNRVRQLQQKHMEEGLPDIKFNFLIGDDGKIYEGRGWNKRPAVYWIENKNFKEYNKNMLEIGYIGIHDMTYLHYSMYETFQKLVGQGVDKKFIQDDYKMWDLFTPNEYEEEIEEEEEKEE